MNKNTNIVPTIMELLADASNRDLLLNRYMLLVGLGSRIQYVEEAF